MLVIGKNTILMDDLCVRIPMGYQIKRCGVNKNELHDVFSVFTPDVILVCLNREENGELMLYDLYFKQDPRNRNIPLIVAGKEEETVKFDSYIDNSNTMYVYRPLTFEKIYQAIDYVFSKLERKMESQVELERPKNLSSLLEEPKKKRVLVIDDDIRLLKTMQNQLAGIYQVAVATSGMVALKFLETHTCDAILLDYVMPGEDGPTVFTKIRQLKQCANTPVIFLTGMKDAATVKQCLLMKPQGYLLKPVRHDKLLKQLEDVMKS